MKLIKVNTTSNDYNIVISSNFESLQQNLIDVGVENKKVCVITDDNVSKYYLDNVINILSDITSKLSYKVIPHGEINKNLGTINTIYQKMIEEKMDRDSYLIALGGGVTGDMVGFASATFMRGNNFIQIPTTLLSQVDSSIGGKTGVDFEGYKNIIGSFHQPELVYINTSTLSTLPKKEVSAGMGEIIKHGLIADKDYFDFIKTNSTLINQLDSDVLEDLIYRSCVIKSDIVSQDEKEKGIRATLNFGHTIGHAVERLFDFKLLHGECVAIGMVSAAYLSFLLNQIDNKQLEDIKKCIRSFDLPTEINTLEPETIYNELFHDKKTKNDILNIILLKGIGTCEIRNDIEKERIIEAIKYIL
ncbi:3-dehydroquinate synthase [Vallitalea longa]|uniref:3-dehydroquinate synthase n=1 Tax=Vallitalea longa TaxID=2936439 RepID=A0A9W5Y9W0_9FIRM|nr:3-dehydroquinate synthase [Vallitalea longa]GKX28791.1 3-dehydroquinate synthase [Vallitalea longa]